MRWCLLCGAPMHTNSRRDYCRRCASFKKAGASLEKSSGNSSEKIDGDE